MKARTITATLIACLANMAVVAGVAQGAWTIEGKTLAERGLTSESVSVTNNTDFTLTGEVGTTKLELTAKKLECTSGVTCKIDEEKVPGHSAGTLTFTEVEVLKPASCTVHSPGAANGTVTTTPLTDQVIMDPSGGTATFDKFFPETGETFVNLELTGASCPLAELALPVRGTIIGRAVHASDIPSLTGEEFVEQSLLFNEAEQKTAGALLYMNNNKEKPAYLDGTAVNTLNGANKGRVFGVD